MTLPMSATIHSRSKLLGLMRPLCLILTLYLSFTGISLAKTDPQLLHPGPEQSLDTDSKQPSESAESITLTPAEQALADYDAILIRIGAKEAQLMSTNDSIKNATGEELNSIQVRQFQQAQDLVSLYLSLTSNLTLQRDLSLDITEKIDNNRIILLNLKRHLNLNVKQLNIVEK